MGQNEVNRAEIVAQKFSIKVKEPLANESFQTISKPLCECWLLIEQKKSFVLLCPIGERNFRVTFVCSNYMAFYFNLHLRTTKKSGNHFRCQKEIYFKIYLEFSLGLIRGIENSGLCLPVCDALAAVRHTPLILSGTCSKTTCAALKNCSRPKNIEIKLEKRKIKCTSQYFQSLN